jgi:copper(I)-binding protein
MRAMNITMSLLLAGLLTACGRPPPPPQGIEVADAWIRVTPSPVLAGYLTVTQHGAEADRLKAISSARFGRIEMHEVSGDGGVMRMRALREGVALPPGQPVTFAPGGNHLMLFDARPAVKAGEMVELTLLFEKAPPRKVQAAVRPAG